MPDEMQEVQLATLGRGGAAELFDAELERAIADCLDPNADPKAARTVTLTVKLKPTEDRSAASVDYKVSAKLAGPKPQQAVVFIGREKGRAIALDRIQHTAFPGEESAVTPINRAAGA